MAAPRTWLEKADRYLASAQLLLEADDYESAVSRAYYAARYAAIHLFLARQVPWREGWKHKMIKDRMIEQARRLLWLRAVKIQSLTFGESWAQLLENRSIADYDLGDRITERVAQRSYVFAQAVVQTIKENMP